MRSLMGRIGAVVLIGGPTVLAFFSGGFFDRPRIVAAIVAWALVIVAVLVAPRPLPASTAGRAALAGLVLLTVWTGLSLVWAPLGGRAQDDLQRLLLYVGFFISALALVRGEQARRLLEPLLVLGALIVVGYGLSERLLPDLIELSRSRSAAGRLEQPISYWNALGAVAAIGMVLAVRVAGDVRRDGLLRAVTAAAGVPLGLGVYLSFSRGALAAVVAGVVILLALAPSGRAQLRSAIAIGAAAGLAALVATGLDSVQSPDLRERGDAGDGIQMLVAIAVLSLAAAVIAPRAPAPKPGARSLAASRPVVVMGVACVLAVAGIGAVAVFEGKPEGTSPARGADPERLRSIDTNRYQYWSVALEAWLDEPIRGIGTGGFQVRWLMERDRVDASGEAHSLYLETVAELGLIGLVFLLLFASGIGAGLVKLYRLDPAVAAGPAAGLAAFAIHAGIDWDWEMPAVSLLGLLLAAAGLAFGEAYAPAVDETRDATTAPNRADPLVVAEARVSQGQA